MFAEAAAKGCMQIMQKSYSQDEDWAGEHENKKVATLSFLENMPRFLSLLWQFMDLLCSFILHLISGFAGNAPLVLVPQAPTPGAPFCPSLILNGIVWFMFPFFSFNANIASYSTITLQLISSFQHPCYLHVCFAMFTFIAFEIHERVTAWQPFKL